MIGKYMSADDGSKRMIGIWQMRQLCCLQPDHHPGLPRSSFCNSKRHKRQIAGIDLEMQSRQVQRVPAPTTARLQQTAACSDPTGKLLDKCNDCLQGLPGSRLGSMDTVPPSACFGNVRHASLPG